MATPTVTFRVPLDQRSSVRTVVNAIKDEPGLTAAVLDFIAGWTASDDPVNLGPFRSEEAALSFIVGRLKAALRPEAIYLFGSRATDDARPDSDFDLLVVLSDEGPPDYFAAHAPVAGSGLGVDVVPCRLADFEAERGRPGTLPYAAEREGRLLYGRPGSRFRTPRRRRREQ